MNIIPTPVEIAENGQFQIQTRQAVLAAQHSSKLVGLLVIDLDGSDSVALDSASQTNDARECAFVLVANSLRDSDALCRITGTETAVLLSSLGNSTDALTVAEKILHKLEQPFQLQGRTVSLKPQCGVALYPHHASNASGLLECAFIALNAARRKKERCVPFSFEFGSSRRPPLRLSELRQAIVQDQLFLLYQPKIDLRNNRIIGLEVLTRWRHPDYGLIMPDEFIPLAERTGLIVPLTLWVLKNAINQWRSWHDRGIDISIAVNLSMWNLETPELAEQIADLLSISGIPASQLELEITESAIMDDPRRTMRTLKSIRELGVHFTIDDFGTGYSSLAHLKKLPVSSIKIDKTFTQNMESDNDSAVIVRAIVDLGHNLGLNVVAEGVETSEAKDMLTDFDCDEAQGYYFSRPVTAGDIFRLMKKAKQPSLKPGMITQVSPAFVRKKTDDIPLRPKTHL
ncbi:MAG: GGDEF domain-containing phosphodiesterase [Deltaproteobacteria bacterium]|nr:GGDEF domain-containing phosphodiesterase [Deltaproteobacteria bacterium]